MTIDVISRNVWISATDGVNITPAQLIESSHRFTTGMPYVVMADSLAGLLNKLYVNPSPYSGGDQNLILIGGYHIESLTKKSSEQIIAAAENE